MARGSTARHERAARRDERLDPVRWGRPRRGSLIRVTLAAVLLLTSAAVLWHQPTQQAQPPSIRAPQPGPAPPLAQRATLTTQATQPAARATRTGQSVARIDRRAARMDRQGAVMALSPPGWSACRCGWLIRPRSRWYEPVSGSICFIPEIPARRWRATHSYSKSPARAIRPPAACCWRCALTRPNAPSRPPTRASQS